MSIHPNVIPDMLPQSQTLIYILGLFDVAHQRGLVEITGIEVTDKGRDYYRQIKESGFKMPKLILLYALRNAKMVGLPVTFTDIEASRVTDVLIGIQEETQ